jgi:tetratricopeptide (TPR) repeat protein
MLSQQSERKNSMQHSNALAQHYATLIGSLCDISEVYYLLGRMDDALNVLKASEQLLEANEVQSQDHIRFLLQYGKVLIRRFFLTNQDGDVMQAIVQRAEQLAETAQDERAVANALALLAQVHYYFGLNAMLYAKSDLDAVQDHYNQSLSYAQQALERGEALHDTRVMSEALFYTGLVHERRRQQDQAQDYYTRALHIAEQHHHKAETSFAARHLSGIALDKGDLQQALEYALQSLHLREEIGFKSALPLAHLLVSDVYRVQNNLTDALFHAQQAYALAKDLEQKDALTFSLFTLGDVYLAQKEPGQARAHFEQALALAQALQLAYAISQVTERLKEC